MNLDSLDRAIIHELRQDGRLSNVALADRVGLTPGPCLRRVQRLESDGVIRGYQAVINPTTVNQSFEVIIDVGLTAYDRDSVESFEQQMSGFDEVIELYRLFGSPDYFVRVAVADLEAYEAFLSANVLTISGVAKVSSRFPMKVIKSLTR